MGGKDTDDTDHTAFQCVTLGGVQQELGDHPGKAVTRAATRRFRFDVN